MLMASYTTAISRLPVLPAYSRCSWRSSLVFKPSYYAMKCWRPLTVTCALPVPEKERATAFSIPPTALLCPVPPPDGKERWDIKEYEDRVTLWLQVPGVSAKDIEVTTSGDVLEIKRKVAAGNGQQVADVHGVGAFHIRLLMTSEYEGSNVTADLKEGMLEVTVPKVPQRKGEPITLGAPPREKDASTKVSDETKLNENHESKAGPGQAS